MNQGHPKWRPVRAWSLYTNEWVYGWYFREDEMHIIIPFESLEVYVNSLSRKFMLERKKEWHLVDSDSVGMCMGKAYRDITHEGHDIAFEGDILELKDCFYEIYWMEKANQFRLVSYDCRNEHDKSRDIQFLVVATYMGNRFENPELLRDLQKKKEQQ